MQKKSIEGVSLEWKIPKIFSRQYESNYCDVSPNFILSGVSYYLKILLNEEWGAENTGWVSVYLKRRQKLPMKRCISYTIGIRACNGSVFRSFSNVSEFQESDNSDCTCSGYGEDRFLKTSELLSEKARLSKDDSLTLFCVVHDCTLLPEETESAKSKESASQTASAESIDILQENFKNLVVSGRLGDVTFVVKDRQLQAHRLILVARSRVFSAMFEHETEEKKSGVVNVDDCDPDSFQDFLTFLYTGSLDVVSSSNAVELYKMADKYDLKDLKRGCVRFMNETLSSESFFDVVPLAALHDESNLLENATEFFVKNMKLIFPNPKWQIFMRDNSNLANELLIQMANKVD